MTAKIYAVFPAVGKTHFANHAHKRVLDIDSSGFDKSEFPQNYFECIKSKLEEADTILVTCHEEIINTLLEDGINLTLIYPQRELKEEYLQRFKDRGDTPEFIQSLSKNWGDIITRLEQTKGERIILESGQYLADVISV